MGSLDYIRMPGSGDLLGDSGHPNSPDYTPAPPTRSDAIESVVMQLGEDEELAGVVSAVAESRLLLSWIAHNVDTIPAHLLPTFRKLDRTAKWLDDCIDEQMREDAA